jgi:hypothetical protein
MKFLQHIFFLLFCLLILNFQLIFNSIDYNQKIIAPLTPLSFQSNLPDNIINSSVNSSTQIKKNILLSEPNQSLNSLLDDFLKNIDYIFSSLNTLFIKKDFFEDDAETIFNLFSQLISILEIQTQKIEFLNLKSEDIFLRINELFIKYNQISEAKKPITSSSSLFDEYVNIFIKKIITFNRRPAIAYILWIIFEKYLLLLQSKNQKSFQEIQLLYGNSLNQLLQNDCIVAPTLYFLNEFIKINPLFSLHSILEKTNAEKIIKIVQQEFKYNIESDRLNQNTLNTTSKIHYKIGYHFFSTLLSKNIIKTMIIGNNGWKSNLINNLKDKLLSKTIIYVVCPLFNLSEHNFDEQKYESDLISYCLMYQSIRKKLDNIIYIPLKVIIKSKNNEYIFDKSNLSLLALFLGEGLQRLEVSFSGFDITYRPLESSPAKYNSEFFIEEIQPFNPTDPLKFLNIPPWQKTNILQIDWINQFINNQSLIGNPNLFQTALTKPLFLYGLWEPNLSVMNYAIDEHSIYNDITLKVSINKDVKNSIGIGTIVYLNTFFPPITQLGIYNVPSDSALWFIYNNSTNNFIPET